MKKFVPALVLMTLTVGCRSMGMGGAAATAILEPRSQSTASGTVTFTALEGDRLRVQVDIVGVEPNGKHGFHVHETGDCSAPDASSAGGHFNPAGHPHAGRDESMRHAGDFGNVTANADGEIHEAFEVSGELSGDSGILGKALVLHAAPDDLTTQPTGNSGARIACGTIARR
jgi:Cu-Zn family superoxide dismutase